MTFPADYSSYDKVTIDRTKVPSGGLTNYDVWIPKSLLTATAQAGLRSLGQDARFTSQDGATQHAGYPVLAKEAVSGVSIDCGTDAGRMQGTFVPATDKPITMGAWVNLGATAYERIIYLNDNSGSVLEYGAIMVTGDKVTFGSRDSSGSYGSNSSSTSVPASTWTFIAVVVDGSGSLYFQVGATYEDPSVTITRGDWSGADTTCIGGWRNGAQCVGKISMPFIYNGAASSAQLAQLAAGTHKPSDVFSSNLWSCEDAPEDNEGTLEWTPTVGTGTLTEVGTVTVAASDPPVFNQSLAGFRVKLPSISDTVDTQFRVWHNGIDDGLAVDAPYGRDATLSELRAFWPMNNNPNGGASGAIIDETGNGYDGTSHSSMDSSDLVTGKVNQAMDFDGSDDYVSIPTTAITGSVVSVDFWAKIDSGTTCKLFEHNSDGTADGGYFKFGASSGFLDYNVWSSAGDITLNSLPRDNTQWTHVMGVAVEGSHMSLFINGSEVDSDACGTFQSVSTFGAAIGADRRGTFTFTDGQIENVRVSLSELGTAEALARTNNEGNPDTFFSSSVAMTATSGVRRAGRRAWAAMMTRGGV